jgi:hypothetical protein
MSAFEQLAEQGLISDNNIRAAADATSVRKSPPISSDQKASKICLFESFVVSKTATSNKNMTSQDSSSSTVTIEQ